MDEELSQVRRDLRSALETERARLVEAAKDDVSAQYAEQCRSNIDLINDFVRKLSAAGEPIILTIEFVRPRGPIRL